MKIERWFQGSSTCIDNNKAPMSEGIGSECLVTQAMKDGLPMNGWTQIADIIERHFPARIGCQSCQREMSNKLVHFNNHRETSKEDVDKVLKIYTEEVEAGHATR